jgi:hypothetical protein
MTETPVNISDSENAASSTPWLGVHALTEFVYCPRAGLVEHAKGSRDIGDEIQREPWASLSYSPPYDMAAIDDGIALAQKSLLVWGVCSTVLVSAAVASYFRLGIAWLLVALGAYLCSLQFLKCLLDLLLAIWVRWHVLNDRALEPDPTKLEDQEVDWWTFIRAGYDSVRYDEGDGLKSQTLCLAGRPWRVLRRGSVRIPVFKKRHSAKANGHTLHDQHYVRIAAYCRLIEEAERAESPYGIILFDDCYKGWAINAAAAERRIPLAHALEGARERIQTSLEGGKPDPMPASFCKGCPTGKPRAHRPGETETLRRGVPLPVFGAIGRDRRVYHSACGDHFRWLPPHERVREKWLVVPSTEALA